MIIRNRYTLLSVGNFEQSLAYKLIEKEIESSIQAVKYPDGSDGFYLNNSKKANGVLPIKNGFIAELDNLGWKNEKICDSNIKDRNFDSSKCLGNSKYFGVEWETGNIASSHRSINRILLAAKDGLIEGGAIILPSREMYRYLTDRVGNFQEIAPYFPVWQDQKYAYISRNQCVLIKVFEIEHDGLSPNIPPISKGTDGRAKR